MARVTVAPSADADTTEILAFLVAEAGYEVASKYSASFERIFDNLVHFPDFGARRPRVGKNIRICVLSPYIVIYRRTKSDDVVRVLRIVHGSRKITGTLLRGAK